MGMGLGYGVGGRHPFREDEAVGQLDSGPCGRVGGVAAVGRVDKPHFCGDAGRTEQRPGGADHLDPEALGAQHVVKVGVRDRPRGEAERANADAHCAFVVDDGDEGDAGSGGAEGAAGVKLYEAACVRVCARKAPGRRRQFVKRRWCSVGGGGAGRGAARDSDGAPQRISAERMHHSCMGSAMDIEVAESACGC